MVDVPRAQPKYCVREALTFDAPPNCWCSGCMEFEEKRVLGLELATGHVRAVKE